MAEVKEEVVPQGGDDLENHSSPETSVHEGSTGRGGSGTFLVDPDPSASLEEDSDSSNYTDCTSSSDEFKSCAGEGQGLDEVEEVDETSSSEDEDYVVSSSESDEDDDDLDVACLCVNTVGGLLTVPYVDAGLRSADLPLDVERENRKNIVKTLQGQADIINNWSSIKKPDGRQLLKFMDGVSTIATKFHKNLIKTGRDSVTKNKPAENVPPPGQTKTEKKDAEEKEKSEEENKSEEEVVPRKKTYSCVRCPGQTKFSKMQWNKHVIVAHGKFDVSEDLHTCLICDKVFGYRHSVAAHMKTHKTTV